MANSRRAHAFVVVSAALLTACGGGGDEGTPHDFSGKYSGTLSRVSETCHGITESATMGWSANVVQDGRSITVNPGALPFKGRVGSDNVSFEAKASMTYASGSSTDFVVGFRVTDAPSVHAVTYSYTLNFFGVPCTANFSGNVQRQ